MTWPVEPPIPELDNEMMYLPDGDLQPSGVASVGTCKSLSHRIFGFRSVKLTAGGITPCSMMRHALTREARKAAASRCLNMCELST